MKNLQRFRPIRLLAGLVAATVGFRTPSESKAAPQSDPVAGKSTWEQRLRQAGASAAEIAQIQDADLTPEVLAHLAKATGREVIPLLTRMRREAIDDAPTSIYPQNAPVASSDNLRRLSIQNTTIESVATDELDGSLRITAVVTNPPAHDRVTVFIALPATNWNGRFMGTGGGGFSGGNRGNLRVPVAKGYAVAATDAGHSGSSAAFALDSSGRLDWQAIRDDAYLGIHEMTVVGKAFATAFYGNAPRYSYFVGGSTAGREALMEAQRYPQDYDGIVALYPGIYRPSLLLAELWPQVVMREAGDLVPKAKLDAATAAAVAACHGPGGFIDDPSHCTFDPHVLVGTKVGDWVLTATDADVILKIWEGPRRRSGEAMWYGPSRGADLSLMAATGGVPLIGKPRSTSIDWIRYFLRQQPSWNDPALSRAEYETLWDQSYEEYETIYGTDDPNLQAFRAHGGKLLLLHGLADQISPAQATIDYYEKMIGAMGGADQVDPFCRLFLVPGQAHGFENVIATPVRLTTAIISWVEEGHAPDHLVSELRNLKGDVVKSGESLPYLPSGLSRDAQTRQPASVPMEVQSIDSFHVGGHRVALQGLPVGPEKRDLNGDYQVGQLYVQEFKLKKPKGRYPLLLWHGGGLTGVTWETTPDGRPGWRDFFLRAGYDTYVSDAYQRGRSGWPPYPEIEQGVPWHRSENQAWSMFRIGPSSGYSSDPGKRTSYPDTQFPTEAMDQFAKQFVPRWTTKDSDHLAEAAYGELVDRVGPCVLLAHSQGCQYALDAELAHSNQIKAVIMIEPALSPDQTRLDLNPVKGIPVLVVWGDHIADSPSFQRWRRVATLYQRSLAKIGGRIEVIDLPSRGIRGNSHMIMMDRNSDQVAQLVERWLEGNGAM